MKKITITNVESIKEKKDMSTRTGNTVILIGEEDMQISDGFHTFDEFYEHRITLFITLCKMLRGYIDVLIKYQGVSESENNPVIWRSKLHNDGTSFDGWFILGITHPNQITYHIPLSRWDDTEFAKTLDKAPEWDGHTSQDVLERLKKL